MALPVVAIIGRPNVGKSSLLNALAGKMISIVEPTAGVTRDRVSTIVGKDDKYFELVDTGGYGIVDADHLEHHIQSQIMQAIASATLVLFVADIREGIVPLDERIAQLLRKHRLDIIGVANKADVPKMFPEAGVFAKLGFGDFLCVSAKNNVNKSLLLEKIYEKLARFQTPRPPQPLMKIAIVGKRNAGKSTMVNAIVGAERVIVSETPGTTRDAVDVRFEKDGKTIVVIDTAGVRKKSKIADSIEFYSFVRVARSVHRADVVLLMIDAAEPVSQPDKKLASLLADEHKACIIVVNKWDLAKDRAGPDDYKDYLTKVLPGLRQAPIAFATANKSRNIQSVLDLAAELFKQATMWVPTPKLNKAFEMIKQESPPSRGRRVNTPKIYYGTQIAVNPVTLLLFVNRTDLFDENYQRFIINKLQSLLPVAEVPIRLVLRPHRQNRISADRIRK